MPWPHIYLAILAIVYFTVLLLKKNGEIQILSKYYVSGIVAILIIVFSIALLGLSIKEHRIISFILCIGLPLIVMIYRKFRSNHEFDRYMVWLTHIYLLAIFSICI